MALARKRSLTRMPALHLHHPHRSVTPCVVVAAAFLLLIHLFGTQPDARIQDDSHLAEPAPTTATQTTLKQPQGAISPTADEQHLAADGYLNDNGHNHTDSSCANLSPSSNAAPMALPRDTRTDLVRPDPASPSRGVTLSLGERSPPDLVRELQVIRV